MIKFFRKIRQNLLSEKKTGKYFKYAIGEILLVVVGILLALQVNNLNENRKRKVIELETLKELQVSLKSNFDNIISATKILKYDVDKIKSLVSHLQAGKPFTEELEELLYYPYRTREFLVNRSAFKVLENRGIDIISNKELRANIVEHYNFSLTRMEGFARSERDRIDEFRTYYQTKIVPNNEDSFVAHNKHTYPKMVPIQYEELLNDQIFISQLKWRISRTELTIDRMEIIWAKNTQDLEKEIIKEIQRLN